MALSQERLFKVRSKDSLNCRPVSQISRGAISNSTVFAMFSQGLRVMKLNMEIIDVLGTDDNPSFHMELD